MNEGATPCIVATAYALISTIQSSYFFLLNSGKQRRCCTRRETMERTMNLNNRREPALAALFNLSPCVAVVLRAFAGKDL